MPDKVQSYRLICKGGLHSNENHLQMSEVVPGAASRLVNYEPSYYGGYRRMDGYAPYDALFPEVGVGVAEGPVLGIALFRNEAIGNPYAIAARKNIGSNTYSFWKHQFLIGWEKMVAAPARLTTDSGLSVNRVRHTQYDFGAGGEIAFVDGVNNLVIFDGINWTTVIPATNDQVLNRPAVVEEFQNHIFVSGDPTFPAIVAHSAPNQSGEWSAVAGGGQVTSGISVVTIKPFRDDLFVFGENSIKKVSVDPTATFTIKAVTSNIGCIARDSVQEIGGDLVFLAPDGIRPVAGTSRIGDVELETISRQIRTRILDIVNLIDVDSLVSVAVRNKAQFRYFFGGSANPAASSLGLIGGLSRNPGEELLWEFADLIGIRASCATSQYFGAKEVVLHGDFNGVVYQQEVGNNFNGLDIVSIYSTPYLDFGDTEFSKLIDKINLFIRPEGPFNAEVTVNYDWNDPKVARPSNYQISSIGGPVEYSGDNIIYSGPGVVYGGGSLPRFTIDNQGTAYAAQVTVITTSQDPSHSVQGIVYEFITSGRK